MRLSLLAALLLAGGAGLTAQDAATALARAQRAYDGLSGVRAEFEQEIVNPMLGAPERSRGVLFLAPPDRFAMRFTEPAGDRIVADGTWLWLYAPSSVPDQVIRQPVPRAGANTPNLFAQFVDRPAQRYQITYVGADTVAGEAADVLRLVPREDDLPFTAAVIAVARRDGLLRRIALNEAGGQRRVLVFRTIAPTTAMPPAELRFRPPEGVKVITP